MCVCVIVGLKVYEEEEQVINLAKNCDDFVKCARISE